MQDQHQHSVRQQLYVRYWNERVCSWQLGLQIIDKRTEMSQSEAPIISQMSFICISEQTAIISLYNINWMVLTPETEHVYCVIWTESLKIIPVNCFFKWLTYSAIMMHTKLSLEQNIPAPVTNSLQTFHTLTTHKRSFLNYPDIAQSIL